MATLLLNQPIVLVDLFMINITPNIFYLHFIFSAYFIFKLIQIIFSPGLCSWQYHRWCLAGTHPLGCSVYHFLPCTFYVVTKRKKRDYMGQSIQEWAMKNLWKTALKKFEVIWSS